MPHQQNLTRKQRKAKARARALRAARVVTIAAALAAPACFTSYGPGGDPVPDATADADLPPDGRVPDARVPDARVPDAMVDAEVDAAECVVADTCCTTMPEECCPPELGTWMDGCCFVAQLCAAVGPLVPPAMPA